ncbi:hypothetical protein RB598_008938 [Gaeumannomyces tritici]
MCLVYMEQYNIRAAKAGPRIDPADRDARDFRQAVRAGDLAAVKSFLVRARDIDINGIHTDPGGDRYGVTVLHEAALERRTEIACLLLALGADPNADAPEHKSMFTPLHCAVKHQYDGNSKWGEKPLCSDLVRLLLNSSADPNIPYMQQDWHDVEMGPVCNLLMERRDRTCQHTLDIIDLLISRGLDVGLYASEREYCSRTFASTALMMGGVEVLEWAISRGAPISTVVLRCLPSEDCTLHLDALKCLVRAGLEDPDLEILPFATYGRKGWTREDFLAIVPPLLARLPERAVSLMPRALCHAAGEHDLPMVEFWLDWGVDVNEYLLEGLNPLLCAARSYEQGSRVIGLLLDRFYHACRSNVLHFAAGKLDGARPELIATLLASGADPDARCERGETPLLKMVKRLRYYMDKNDDPPARASWADAVDCVWMLARAVKDINAVDAGGRTALHLLLHYNMNLMFLKHASMVLCQQGIGIHIRDHDGRTAADILRC